MADDERQSPRTAIQKWLQVTESRLTKKPADAPQEQQNIERGSRHRSRRYRTKRRPVETEDQYNEGADRMHRRHSKSATRQKNTLKKTTLTNPLQARSKDPIKDTAVESNRPGLAERLGLYAPFRTFKEHSDGDIPGTQGRPRKRRRTMSSSSSYLEPAAANDFSNGDRDHPNHAMTLRAAKIRPAQGDISADISSTASQGSETMLSSPEKLLKSYERRPRHKTRSDRYEFKGNDGHGTKAKQSVKNDAKQKKQKKQKKKHKRKEKSGAALMHDFAARNVAPDRLTLKPPKTLGLFGKGKASSPVRRRGLPDLAFNEMTFLNSRQEKTKGSIDDSYNKPLDKRKRRKLIKEADTEAEFSRYFMSAKPTDSRDQKSHSRRYQQDRQLSRDEEPPQALVSLPERPFLGFGSCGPNTSLSPAKSPINRESRSLHREASRSPTRSTSYLSWSKSRGPSYASPPPNSHQHIEPLQSSKLSNRKRTAPAPCKSQHLIPHVSSPGVRTTSQKLRNVTSGPPSKQIIANEGPRQNSESRLAVGERLGSREKSQNSIDTANFKLDAVQPSRDLESSIPNNTRPVEAAISDSPKISSPRHAPPAHDVRPLSAQMPTSPPHVEQLDDILDALLRDCNTNLTGSDPTAHATLTSCNLRFTENSRRPAEVQEYPRTRAHASISNDYTPQELRSATDSSKNPCSASLHLASAIDGSRSTHKGSVPIPNNARSLDTTDNRLTSIQYQVDSGNAWNGYDSCYERQQEQADLMPKAATEFLAPCDAVQEDFLDPSGGIDLGARPSKHVSGRNPVDVRNDLDNYRPDLYMTSPVRNENDRYQKVGHDEWCDDQAVDYGASHGSEASITNMSHEGLDDGNMITDHTNDHQGRERPFSRGDDDPETDCHLFTTNMPDICSSWRPRHLSSSNYGLDAYAADTRFHDSDSAFSQFWTPHKLY